VDVIIRDVDTQEETTTAGRECSPEFWYSKQAVISWLAFLFLLVQSISILIPPFQSPDEFYHLKRAYLLSKGEVFLGKENNVTGGRIDSGLLEYMNNFVNARWFSYMSDEAKKQTKPYIALARDIAWSGKRQFSDVPNVAVYFPLPYLPQALASMLGEQAGWSVSSTYYLARLFSLAATLGLLWGAFRTYPVPIFALALLVTPMTLFQLGSASLDSVSFATCMLAASLFMRGSNIRFSFSHGMHAALLVCLFSLATSRINLIVLTLLPAILYTVRRSRLYLASSSLLIFLSLAWILFVLATVRGGHGNDAPTSLEIIKYYMHHITSLVSIFFATVTNVHLLQSYWYMFVGLLGWSSIEMAGTEFVAWRGILLDSTVYLAWGILLVTLAVISFQRDRACLLSRASLALAFAATFALLIIFPILLVTWTPHPAQLIVGVQGRYFTPILILLSFSAFSRRLSPAGVRAGLFIIFLMAAISITDMAPKLLNQYWISEL
jgi:uncharacterized membrane protein